MSLMLVTISFMRDTRASLILQTSTRKRPINLVMWCCGERGGIERESGGVKRESSGVEREWWGKRESGGVKKESGGVKRVSGGVNNAAMAEL